MSKMFDALRRAESERKRKVDSETVAEASAAPVVDAPRMDGMPRPIPLREVAPAGDALPSLAKT